MKSKIVNIPYLSFKTHCIVYGDVHKRTPIIILHGGPGGCVERYEALTHLADQGIPLILYDQLGCGYSKVPKGHTELWTYETYMNELENVIAYFKLEKYIILGHSWGGMLALEWVTNREHKGLEKLILYSTLPSTKMWNDEHLKMIANYPDEERENLIRSYDGKSVQIEAFKRGLQRFYHEHVGKKKDLKYVNSRKRFPKLNKEIYEYMWGPSELFGTGTLKDWSTEDKLHKIDVPTLIMSGEFDESTISMNKFMQRNIKNSQYFVLEGCHHASYRELPEKVRNIIIDFYKNDKDIMEKN